MASDKQIAANQQNAQQSTGPRDTSRTRGNATKHGLTAATPTGLEWPEFERRRQVLTQHFQPVGPIEQWLVGKIALHMSRLAQALTIEWAYLSQQFEQSQTNPDPALVFLSRVGLPGAAQREGVRRCTLAAETIEKVNSSIGRYETALENKLFRAMHELERLQRQRQGEAVPAPAAGDLTLHGDASAIRAARDSSEAIRCST